LRRAAAPPLRVSHAIPGTRSCTRAPPPGSQASRAGASAARELQHVGRLGGLKMEGRGVRSLRVAVAHPRLGVNAIAQVAPTSITVACADRASRRGSASQVPLLHFSARNKKTVFVTTNWAAALPQESTLCQAGPDARGRVPRHCRCGFAHGVPVNPRDPQFVTYRCVGYRFRSSVPGACRAPMCQFCHCTVPNIEQVCQPDT